MRFVVLILSTLLLIGAWTSYASKTNKIVVKIKPGVSIEELCSSHPLVKLERPSTLPRVFLFSVENIHNVDKETNKFISDTRVVWAHNDEIFDEMEADGVLPSDPLLEGGQQWFHGHINTSYAWSKGLSGQRQIVQVIDSPVFPEEADLQGQLDFARSFEGNITAPPGSGAHGTICTNLIVAKMNDFCGVGVAFSATAAVFPFISNPVRRFSAIEFAEAYASGFHVSSNSYGIVQCTGFGCNIDMVGFIPAVRDALELSQDRNNTVFVFTAGNEGRNEGSPNFRSSGSTPRAMVVGATRYDGTRATYSNVGAANWIVAPAGDHNENVTWTSSVTANGQQCGQVGVGTSWAAPMVSGAAAILRSAYPWLSWRDVKYVLAYSADKTDSDHPSWIQNRAGRWFSNHYGFGQLNVGKAVELGATWKNLGPLQIRNFHSFFEPIVFSLRDNVTIVEGQVSVPHGIIKRIESVQLTLNMNLNRRGEFQIDLISPEGTSCTVFPFRNDRNRNYMNYITSANCFLDEEPGGLWTLRAEMRENVTRGFLDRPDRLISFSVTVWGETLPSQVELLTSPTATRLSNFKITEGDTFQHLSLFHNFPATIGLFWKDTFGLYGELFTTEGEATTGTQRLNPSNSDHPTISVFYGGDHVLTYLTTINDTLVMKAEVRNIDFVPLTPLTVLPLEDINPEYMNTIAVADNLIVTYKSSSTSFAKLVLLDVDFGSRDVTPLCIPTGNVTSDADDDVFGDDGNCTEVVYRRDGQISFSKQMEIRTQAPVQLQSIGMNLVLGTWIEGSTVYGALIRSDLSVNITILRAPFTSVIRSAATPEDVFIAFGHSDGVVVERYDKNMNLHESFDVATADPVVAIDLAYTHVQGLSLLIATTKNVSVTLFLRSYDRTFVQTNKATVASMLSTNVPVLDADQSVMPNGDLVVAFSTFQEIHVQVFKSSIFGTAPLPPLIPPLAPNEPAVVETPVIEVNVPVNEEIPVSTPQEDQLVEDPENQFPSWAIALIVLVGTMALFFGLMVLYLERKKRQQRAKIIAQQDPDLIAYTKMSV